MIDHEPWHWKSLEVILVDRLCHSQLLEKAFRKLRFWRSWLVLLSQYVQRSSMQIQLLMHRLKRTSSRAAALAFPKKRDSRCRRLIPFERTCLPSRGGMAKSRVRTVSVTHPLAIHFRGGATARSPRPNEWWFEKIVHCWPCHSHLL